MAREYLNVCLSYEAKYWLELLQEIKQQELNNHIMDLNKNKFIEWE